MAKILCSGQAGFSKFDTVDLARIKSYETLNLKVAAGSSLTTVFKTLNCLQISYFQGFFDFLLIFPQIAIKEKKRPPKSLFWPISAFFRKQPKFFFCFSRHFRPFWKFGKNFPKIYGLEFRHIWTFSSFRTQNLSVFRISEPCNVQCRMYRIANTFPVNRRPLSLYF